MFCPAVSLLALAFAGNALKEVKFMVRAKVGLTTREATRRVEDVEL